MFTQPKDTTNNIQLRIQKIYKAFNKKKLDSISMICYTNYFKHKKIANFTNNFMALYEYYVFFIFV